MNVADIVAELDDHGFSDTASTRKLAFLNDTVWDICSRLPWSFLEAEVDLTFDGTNPQPTNWPANFKAALMVTDPTTGNQIRWERWDSVQRTFANAMTQGGAPNVYYFVAKKGRFYPVPGASQTLHMLYLRRHPTLLQSDLESAILIPADHHEAITLGTLVKLYRMEDDPELSILFKGEFEERLAKMTEDLERTQYDSNDMVFMVDPEDYDAYPYQ